MNFEEDIEAGADRLVSPEPVLREGGSDNALRPKSLDELGREFLGSRALLFLSGFLTLLAGLAIVNTHNVWIASWPVIITAFGWLMIVAGILRMALPAQIRPIGEAMLANKTFLRLAGGAQAVLGAFLMFKGYL